VNLSKTTVDRLLLFLLAVLVVAFVFVLKNSIQEPHVEPGQKAPNFAFKTDDGREFSRSEFGGRLLVLNFWASWCVPCVEEMPSLNRLATELRDDGVVVAGVSVDLNEEAYRRFVQRWRPNFSTLRDPASGISYSFGTFMIPETYVIDRSGRVRQKYISNRNWVDPAIVKEIRGFLSERD
jgi:cytochrome c biogenesis protein CcmG, thiol:disulfide interchange protein DsbE